MTPHAEISPGIGTDSNPDHGSILGPIHGQRVEFQTEIQRLHRERSIVQLENRILTELVQCSDFVAAANSLLRRLVPRESSGFAALLDVTQQPPRTIAVRGQVRHAPQQLSEPISQLHRHPTQRWQDIRGSHPAAAGAGHAVMSQYRVNENAWLIAIRNGSELVAVLYTNSLWPAGAATSEQLGLLSRLGAVLGRIVVSERELRRQQDELKSTQEMLAFRSIVDEMATRPLESLGSLASRIRDSLSVDRVSIYLRSRRADDDSEAVASSGTRNPEHVDAAWRKHEARLAWQAMMHRAGGTFDAPRLASMGIDSLIGFAGAWPLIHEDRVLGSVVLTQKSEASFDKQRIKLLEWSAELLAGSLRRLFDEAAIRRQARQDGLTNLANRRTFDTLLAGEIDRVRLGLSAECSLLLADLDHFKSVNDLHGHPAGDEVLRVIAQLMRDYVGRMRVGERIVLARYGGEEMAVLLPGVGLAGALRLAEEIRAAVQQRTIHFQEKSLGVTISLGAASCPQHALTSEAIVTAADRALYRAKSEGRNRVCLPSSC